MTHVSMYDIFEFCNTIVKNWFDCRSISISTLIYFFLYRGKLVKARKGFFIPYIYVSYVVLLERK